MVGGTGACGTALRPRDACTFPDQGLDTFAGLELVNLAASTYANVAAIPDQKRTITLLTSDELKFDNPRTPNGMTLRTTWKRAVSP